MSSTLTIRVTLSRDVSGVTADLFRATLTSGTTSDITHLPVVSVAPVSASVYDITIDKSGVSATVAAGTITLYLPAGVLDAAGDTNADTRVTVDFLQATPYQPSIQVSTRAPDQGAVKYMKADITFPRDVTGFASDSIKTRQQAPESAKGWKFDLGDECPCLTRGLFTGVFASPLGDSLVPLSLLSSGADTYRWEFTESAESTVGTPAKSFTGGGDPLVVEGGVLKVGEGVSPVTSGLPYGTFTLSVLVIPQQDLSTSTGGYKDLIEYGFADVKVTDDGHLRFYDGNNAFTTTATVDSAPFHLAVTNEGSAFKVYKDGALIGSSNDSYMGYGQLRLSQGVAGWSIWYTDARVIAGTAVSDSNTLVYGWRETYLQRKAREFSLEFDLDTTEVPKGSLNVAVEEGAATDADEKASSANNTTIEYPEPLRFSLSFQDVVGRALDPMGNGLQNWFQMVVTWNRAVSDFQTSGFQVKYVRAGVEPVTVPVTKVTPASSSGATYTLLIDKTEVGGDDGFIGLEVYKETVFDAVAPTVSNAYLVRYHLFVYAESPFLDPQIWLDFADAGTLYTDTSKTTLVTGDGQRIRAAKSKTITQYTFSGNCWYVLTPSSRHVLFKISYQGLRQEQIMHHGAHSLFYVAKKGAYKPWHSILNIEDGDSIPADYHRVAGQSLGSSHSNRPFVTGWLNTYDDVNGQITIYDTGLTWPVFFVVSVRYTSDKKTAWRNGVIVDHKEGVDVSTRSRPDATVLLNDARGEVEFGEFLYYQRALSDVEMAIINAALMAKWAAALLGFPDIWVDFSDVSTMYQDVEGAVAVTSNGQYIQSIKSKSSTQRIFAAPSVDDRPTYIKSSTEVYASFTDSDSLVMDAVMPVGPYTLFYVARKGISPASHTAIWIGREDESYINHGISEGVFSSGVNSHITIFPHSDPWSKFYLITELHATNASGNRTVWKDMVQLGTVSGAMPNVASDAKMHINGVGLSPSGPTQGYCDYAEILYYNRVLSTDARAAIHSLLVTKWAALL